MARITDTYHHGDLHAALLQSAAELLEQLGQDGISLRGVARAAGVSHNAPYHHFADKEALLAALAAWGQRRLLEAQLTAALSEGDPVQTVLNVGMAYVGFAQENPQWFTLIFDPKYCGEDTRSPEMARSIEENEVLLADLTAQLCPQFGESERAIAAAALWSSAHGSAQLVANGHLPAEAVRKSLQLTVSLFHGAE